MSAERKYTTQLQAGLGMVPETMALLRLWQPGQTASNLANSAVQTGLFSRATARRARNLAAEMFAPRYLVSGGVVASRLKYLLERQLPHDSLAQLFFLQTARAQHVFGDFVVEVYWPKYCAGAHTISKEDARRFIREALDAGRMKKRWSESTVTRVAGYLIGCCVDFGLLAGPTTGERAIKRFSVRPDVALYLAHDIHFAGVSDMSLVQHPDWRLFGLEPQDVLHLMQTLSHDGHLLIQSTADLVQVSWKYRSMEECLDALTER